MTVPAVGLGGPAGWRVMQATSEARLTRFAANPLVARDRAAFEGAAEKLTSAEALTGDWTLMKVALTAFGLEADLPNKAFIRKVLEADPDDPQSLVNRLTDRRYRQLSETFGIGSFLPPDPEAVARKVSALYLEREFERQIGQVEPEMRLALNAQRELAALAARPSSEATKWYEVLGTPPLRRVFEGALGLPSSFVRLPIDRQLELMSEAASRRFGIGSFEDLASPANRNRLIETFLARAGGGSPSPVPSTLSLLARV